MIAKVKFFLSENLKKLGGKIKFKINLAAIKRYYIWILLGILIFALVLSRTMGLIKEVFFGIKKDKGKEAVEIMETVPVKAYKVKRMDFKDTLPAMGRVEGVKEIELKFDGKGVIESFNFEEGERILEGDIIASVDQKDALLKMKYASLDLEKNEKLFELGGVDKLAVDQKKLEYESAKRDLEKTNIYAPADGYLGSKELDPGTFVSSQDKIGIFVDFTQVYATFDVIEEDSPKIELGQNAEIFFDAYPGTSYTGTIDTISPMIEGRTRTQKIRVELDNSKNELKPGMFARAIINTYEKKDALIIPASAFKKQENKFFIYVVVPIEEEEKEEIEEEEEEEMEEEEKEPDAKGAKGLKAGEGEEGGEFEEEPVQEGNVQVREISIEYLTHDMAEVGKGVAEGELIIRELHREYKDGEKVEITEVQETIL